MSHNIDFCVAQEYHERTTATPDVNPIAGDTSVCSAWREKDDVRNQWTQRPIWRRRMWDGIGDRRDYYVFSVSMPTDNIRPLATALRRQHDAPEGLFYPSLEILSRALYHTDSCFTK